MKKDLLEALNRKDSTVSASSNKDAKATQTIVGGHSVTDNVAIGDVLTESKSKEVPSTNTESDDKKVKNPDEWSKDSALKEVVKLREENKAVRLKFQEQLDKISKETEAQIAKIKEEAQSAVEAKKKLEALEADQADKKRTIEEKLAIREARLAELETTFKFQIEEKEKELSVFKYKAAQYEAEQEARAQVYKNQIKEELDKISEDFRPYAEKLVKGVEDAQEAWLTLKEAVQKGLFGEKKIVINHSTPGANDGARTNRMKLEEEDRANKKKLSPQDLIRRGLNQAKTSDNSMFRARK
jgi:hypothetical protein